MPPLEVPKCRTCKGTSSLWFLVNFAAEESAYACPGHLHALMTEVAGGRALHVQQLEAVVTVS